MKHATIIIIIFMVSLTFLILYRKSCDKFDRTRMPANPRFLSIDNRNEQLFSFNNLNDFNILAKVIAENYSEYDGIIILNDKKTSKVLGCILSRMITSLSKPIVISEKLGLAKEKVSKVLFPSVIVIKDGIAIDALTLKPLKRREPSHKLTIREINPEKRILIATETDVPKILEMDEKIDGLILKRKVSAKSQLSEMFSELRKKIPVVIMNSETPIEILYAELLVS